MCEEGLVCGFFFLHTFLYLEKNALCMHNAVHSCVCALSVSHYIITPAKVISCYPAVDLRKCKQLSTKECEKLGR